MRLFQVIFLVLILTDCVVVSQQRKNAASHLYFKPEGRCMGTLEISRISYNVKSGDADPEPLAVLDGYTLAECETACRLHKKCWGIRVIPNMGEIRSCSLYAKGALKSDGYGFEGSIWECQLEEPHCEQVSRDRCPGFWTAHWAYATVRDELEELRLGKNPAGPDQCGIVHRFGLAPAGCRMACQNERYCSTLIYRPGSSDGANSPINATTQSVCKMPDVNKLFPEYAEQNQEPEEVSGETPSVEDLKHMLASMPSSWIVGHPPATIRWTCCKEWWRMVDTQSEESVQFTRICLNSTNKLLSADNADSLAALTSNCTGQGYWKTTTIKDSVRAVVPAQSLNADGDVVITNLFQTQNPLDCTEECVNNPCCLRPAYVPRNFTCIIFGAADGYPACTAKHKNEYEWSIVWKVGHLPGNEGPVMSWDFACCPHKFRTLNAPSCEKLAKKTPNEMTNKSDFLSTCLCEVHPDKRVEVKTEADLFCPARQKQTKKVRKFLTPPISVILDPTRQVVEADDPFEDWNSVESFRKTTRTEGKALDCHRSSWIPVLTTSYPDLLLWAGPSESLRKCSMLNCRVQVNNEVGQGRRVNAFPSGTPEVPFNSIFITTKDWSAPVCPNIPPPTPFNSPTLIKMLIIDDFHIPRYRCYTSASCVYRMREATLFDYSRSWSGIGYNYMIGNDGRIYEGRGSKYVGAHTAHDNGFSLEIGFTGWYPYNAPNAQSVRAFWALVSALKNKASLTNQTKISSLRDLLASESPGLALHYLIHTLPRSLSENRRIGESDCPQRHSDPPAMSIIGALLASSLFVILGLLGMTLYLSHKIDKLRKNGLTEDILSHTTNCQEWHEVCKRVAEEREIFGILPIFDGKRPPDYCVSGSSGGNSNDTSRVSSEVSTSKSHLSHEFPSHQPTASTHGELSHTLSSSECVAITVTALDKHAPAASDTTVPDIKLVRATEFLRSYSKMARIRIHFACDPKLNEIPQLSAPIRLLSLFCRSWRTLLIDSYTLPRLIVDSLNALCAKIFRPDAHLPPVCVTLLAYSLDFLVLLHRYPATKNRDLLTELLSVRYEVIPITRAKSILGSCWLFRGFKCHKCEICRPLPPLNQYCADVRSHNRIIHIDLRHILPKFVTHIPVPSESSVSGSCAVRSPVNNEFWMRFTLRQREYSKLTNPVQGRLTDYKDYLAFKDSQNMLEAPLKN
ncbi:unnamed protein product [Calicophoron daubneyi]|uniref:Peptidoglycan recognition protein family domain-containing protein n=2 Tax=Calicophoron daubneyi TaxID=300641 RepID=A0AAV2TVV0_CALDB